MVDHPQAGKDHALIDKSIKDKECRKYFNFMRKRTKELREQATQLINLKITSAMRACIFCCETKHQRAYSKGIQVRGNAILCTQTKKWETMVTKYNTAVYQPRSGGMNQKIKSFVWGLRHHLVNNTGRTLSDDEEVWGYEIQEKVTGYTQVQLLGRGMDWVYQLGGIESRAGTSYACKNPRCRAIPIQSHMWYRVATMILEDLPQAQVE